MAMYLVFFITYTNLTNEVGESRKNINFRSLDGELIYTSNIHY